MNGVKNVIQKEEYIALAINKYILQTGTIPKKNNNTLDWTKLETAEYLGTNFNKKNPSYYVKESTTLMEFLELTLQGQSRTNIKRLF